MEAAIHSMNDLFSQLGLPSTDSEVEVFIAMHSPLANDLTLCEAPFWNRSQSIFLYEGWLVDGDWAVVVDELNLVLRAPQTEH